MRISGKLDYSSLYEPQRNHAHKLLDSLYLNGYAADLSETGCGKSYVALWIAKQMNTPVHIICPKVMVYTWKMLLCQFGIQGKITNFEKIIRGNTPYLHYIASVPTDYSHFSITLESHALVIVDECHKCKAEYSKNGLLLASLKAHKYKLLLLSATAATNPLEMKSFGYVMGLHNYYDFNDWVRHNGGYSDKHGRIKVDVESDVTKRKMMDVHHHMFDDMKCSSRMLRSSFKNIFPKNKVVADVLDMGDNSEKINKIYADMEYELDLLERSTENYTQHAFAIIMKARRLTELLKVPTLVELIDSWYDDHISPVIFLNFNDSVSALTRKLNDKYMGKVAYIIGGQTQRERITCIDQFQRDERRIMICNLRAGNVGISLHDLNGNFARHSVIVPSFSAVDVLQALGRIYRADAKTPCYQRIMFAADTIEEHAASRVSDKLDNLSLLNDGDLTSGLKLV